MRAIFLRFFIAAICFSMFGTSAWAAEYVDISGTVKYDGTPVCGLVLANGQHVFSCSGDGAYELTVPLDANGKITLFGFVSGLTPFQQEFTPAELTDYTINMSTAGDEPELTISYGLDVASRDGWITLRGKVTLDASPVCGLVLANGQHMFSCNANLGIFDLEVPINANGQVTLFAFVSGTQPYSLTFTPRLIPDTNQTSSFTNTFGEDSDYIINPQSFTRNGDGTVTDNVTGLMWQQVGDNNIYNWFQATGTSDTTYNQGGAINACGNLSLAGHDDWRLPSVNELLLLVNNSMVSPAIDESVFPGTSFFYWTSTAHAEGVDYAWLVNFDFGFTFDGIKTNESNVRCVRGQ